MPASIVIDSDNDTVTRLTWSEITPDRHVAILFREKKRSDDTISVLEIERSLP